MSDPAIIKQPDDRLAEMALKLGRPVTGTLDERAERLYIAFLEAAGEFGGDSMSGDADDALKQIAERIIRES